MALITCPECSKEFSDQANACPHCGYPVSRERDSESPELSSVTITAVETEPKSGKKKTGVLIGGIVAVIAIIAIVVAVFAVSKSNKAKARAEYIENLKLAQKTMLDGGAKAESLCNLTKSVWYNTIYEKSDDETDPYTKNSYSGDFHSDFNTSLSALYGDTSTKSTMSSIKANQEEVADIMRDLQNPTDEFKACYETVDSMYEAYQGLTKLAISPSGSLTTFSSNFGTYDSDFMLYYNKLDMQIPEK